MRLLIKLTPMEPYFFGDDRSFQYGELSIQRAAGYISHSRVTPAQTTLFGVLRYLGIKSPNSDFKLEDNDIANIGNRSFNLLEPSDERFGRIISVSPLYLYDSNNRFYIRTPFDHDKTNKNTYEPWEEYSETMVSTDCGKRKFPVKYNEKIGLEDSWTCLDDLSLHANLFKRIMQVGHDKNGAAEAFYKKERVMMCRGMSFAFIAEVMDDFEYRQKTDERGVLYPEKRVVYLGQDKSAFLAEIITDFTEPPFGLLKAKTNPDIAYALSDIFIQPNKSEKTDGIKAFYSTCNFVCAQSTDFRVFLTDYTSKLPHGGRFKKGSELIRLITAGSVFIVNEKGRFMQMCCNKHAEKAGFNHFWRGFDNEYPSVQD